MHVHVFNSESRKEALLQITVRLDGKTKCSSRVHAFVVPSFSHFAFVPVRGRGGGAIFYCMSGFCGSGRAPMSSLRRCFIDVLFVDIPALNLDTLFFVLFSWMLRTYA